MAGQVPTQNSDYLVENPKGTISNSDLEMVGLLLQSWFVLENFANLALKHIA